MWRSRDTSIICDGTKTLLEYKGTQLELDAGCDDDIDVYEDKERVYVLSEHPRYGYVGLQAFDKKTKQEVCNNFLQNPEDEYTGYDGGRWNPNWAPWTKIRALLQGCPEL